MTIPPARQRTGLLPWILLLLTIFGPISMDLYLPVLPALTEELDAVTSVAQLTVTACLVGLALGQLVAGPLSDRLGRRRVLLIGVAAFVVTSVVCAVSTTIESLIVARLLQGVAGGVGIVIAQAAGRDIFEGNDLVRFYGRLTVVTGLAAIVGPLLGGQLARAVDWRGLFLFLALIGAAILLTSAARLPETLPAERRSSGGFAQIARDFAVLLADRRLVGAVLNQGFLYAALFAYLAGSTFVLQVVYDLSPQGYALAFGANSAGFMVFGYLAGVTTERWSVRGTLALGVAVSGLGASGLLLAGLTHMPLATVVVALFLLASGVAISSAPATTLALVGYPDLAGTASSLLGLARFAFGAVAAPLVGVAGAGSILPLGIVTAVAVAASGAACLLTAPAREPEPSPVPG